MQNKIVAILLLLLNLYNYQYGINKYVIFSSSLFIILLYIFLNLKQKKSSNYIFTQLMIFTWPFAWSNIFGTDISEFQLTWFLISAFCFVLFNLINKIKKNVFSFLTLVGIIYSVVPLIMANSFLQGLSDFISIILFFLLALFAYCSKRNYSKEEYDLIVDSFIFECIICSIGVLFQYIMYKNFNLKFFKIHLQGSFVRGSTQSGCELLLEDPSCSSAMLGCGVLMSLIKTKNDKKFYIIAIFILLGLIFTSRRTGIIGLLVVFPLFFLINYKGVIKKFVSIFVLIVFGLIIFYVMAIARPYENTSQLFDSNGRLPDYNQSLILGFNKPFGVGYGDEYLKSQMIHAIPHNSILRWNNFGGLLLVVPIISVFIYSILYSIKSKNLYALWCIIYSVVILNFIPDIINGKFIYIIVILSLNYNNLKIKEGSE